MTWCGPPTSTFWCFDLRTWAECAGCMRHSGLRGGRSPGCAGRLGASGEVGGWELEHGTPKCRLGLTRWAGGTSGGSPRIRTRRPFLPRPRRLLRCGDDRPWDRQLGQESRRRQRHPAGRVRHARRRFRAPLAGSAVSVERLGWEETVRYLKRKLTTCHRDNVSYVQKDLAGAGRDEGKTLFEIIEVHGPGGREAEDNVHLALA